MWLCPHKRTSLPAFTLVELMLATALTAVLMMAVMSSLAAMNSRQAATSPSAQSSSEDAVMALLEQDLLNARTWQSRSDGFCLKGFCAMDPSTKAACDLPVTVLYSVQTVANRSWLIRRQEPDYPPLGQAACDLVYSGVEKITLAKSDDSLGRAIAPGNDNFAPLPDSVKLTLNLKTTSGQPKALTRFFSLK